MKEASIFSLFIVSQVEMRSKPFCQRLFSFQSGNKCRAATLLSGKLWLAFLEETLDGFPQVRTVQQFELSVNLQVLTVAN